MLNAALWKSSLKCTPSSILGTTRKLYWPSHKGALKWINYNNSYCSLSSVCCVLDLMPSAFVYFMLFNPCSNPVDKKTVDQKMKWFVYASKCQSQDSNPGLPHLKYFYFQQLESLLLTIVKQIIIMDAVLCFKVIEQSIPSSDYYHIGPLCSSPETALSGLHLLKD